MTRCHGQWLFTHLHNFSGDFLFAEAIDDNVGRHPGHTEHPALGAPGQGLDGKRVFLYYFCVCLILLTASPLKNLGSLQLVQHLKHYFEKSRNKKSERCDDISPSVSVLVTVVPGSNKCTLVVSPGLVHCCVYTCLIASCFKAY